MRHFLSFQKRKGLYIPKGTESNESLVHQINHELMKYGYVISKNLFDRLSTQNTDYLESLYNDLLTGIRKVTGGGGYEPIYRNFPQSVLELSYTEFLINAIGHYWSFGTWRPEDKGYINREFKLETINYKEISLLEENEYNSIFTDLIYSNTSISAFDKKIIDWFLANNYKFNLSNIKFKEILAYVGQRLLDDVNITTLSIKDATSILRIWSVYSGGDEGLKTNTKFKNPNARQTRVLLNTLNECTNLEESFKVHREKWLRVLFYLNPLTMKNMVKYNNLANYVKRLRNDPKSLKTFNSKVEALLNQKDESVMDLLKGKMGVFTRRLDHLVRLFGASAINIWLENEPNFNQLITAYNHFTERDKLQAGRGAVLASQDKSEVVTYDALEPLDVKLVAEIKDSILSKIQLMTNDTLSDSKVYIDRSLFYRPLGINNRASSLSLDGKGIGTVESIPPSNTIRLYVHWNNRTDIDLSALVITNDNMVAKVGWNGRHMLSTGIIYSGDNTGFSDKNAEYLDIVPSSLPKNIEWIITEARIYSGPRDYSGYNGGARAGWMLRNKPEANNHWLPETLEHSIVLDSKSSTSYLMALHIPTNSLVYLDLAMGNKNISTAEDAIEMRVYLDKFIVSDSDEIQWDRLNQGHILSLLSKEVVDDVKGADLIFDENTTVEEVSKYIL